MKRSLIVVCLLSLLSAGQMFAQREQPSGFNLANVPFNFAPPGARSLGMGASFIGIADDATAAESNPAGLTNLRRPEVSFHVRQTENSLEFFNPLATGNQISTFDDSITSPSFASYVRPIGPAVFSVYYQRAVDFRGENTTTFREPTFFDDFTQTASPDILLEHIGVSGAFKLGNFASVGVSVRNSRLTLDSTSDFQIVNFRDLPNERTQPGVDLIAFRDQFDDTDSDITFNAGILFNPGGRFSFGAVYKEGGEFENEGVTSFVDCLQGRDFDGTLRQCNPQTLAGAIQFSDTLPLVTTIPDVYGVGFAFRPVDRLIIAADAARVTYADRDFLRAARREAMTDPDFDPEDFADAFAEFEEIDDATEFHLGLEYGFLVGAGQTPFFLRAGAFTDPDHDGFSGIDSDSTTFTVGTGVALAQRFQIDLGLSFGDTRDEGILSVVYRF